MLVLALEIVSPIVFSVVKLLINYNHYQETINRMVTKIQISIKNNNTCIDNL